MCSRSLEETWRQEDRRLGPKHGRRHGAAAPSQGGVSPKPVVGRNTTTRQAHVDDLIAGHFSFDIDPSNSDAASTPLTVTEIETGVLEIIVDLSPMMEDDPQQAELQSAEMREIIKAAMDGHAMTYCFTGMEVLETTGQVSADGRTASLTIPMGDFIDKKAPASFRSVIRYQEAGILTMILDSLSSIFEAIWPF